MGYTGLNLRRTILKINGWNRPLSVKFAGKLKIYAIEANELSHKLEAG